MKDETMASIQAEPAPQWVIDAEIQIGLRDENGDKIANPPPLFDPDNPIPVWVGDADPGDLTFRSSGDEPAEPIKQAGVYIASRASGSVLPAMWRKWRDDGTLPITSTWIDEAMKPTEPDMGELWVRIVREIQSSKCLLVYVRNLDLPVRGVYVEAGIALAYGLPVFVATNGFKIEPKTYRPLGSWLAHPNVHLYRDLNSAVYAVRDFLGPDWW